VRLCASWASAVGAACPPSVPSENTTIRPSLRSLSALAISTLLPMETSVTNRRAAHWLKVHKCADGSSTWVYARRTGAKIPVSGCGLTPGSVTIRPRHTVTQELPAGLVRIAKMRVTRFMAWLATWRCALLAPAHTGRPGRMRQNTRGLRKAEGFEQRYCAPRGQSTFSENAEQ
jgi:hypothetical protein